MVGIATNSLKCSMCDLLIKRIDIKRIPQLEFEFPMKNDKSESEDGLPCHQDNQLHHWCQY